MSSNKAKKKAQILLRNGRIHLDNWEIGFLKNVLKISRLSKKQIDKVYSIFSKYHTQQWESYAEYLKSNEWQKIRRKKLKSTNYKCEICGKKATEVHHIKYVIWGTEENQHLQSLCHQCHLKFHKDKPKKDIKRLEFRIFKRKKEWIPWIYYSKPKRFRFIDGKWVQVS